MIKLLQALLIGAGVLLAAVFVAVLAVFLISDERLNRRYRGQPADLLVPANEEALAAGAMLAMSLCADCHGENLAGQAFSSPAFGRIVAGNLTTGDGGIGATYTDQDWVRAIRYGVGPDDRGLILMPSDQVGARLSDADLGALIAYLKSLPPVDNPQPALRLSLPARAGFVLGRQPLLAAEAIDQTGSGARSVLSGAPLAISDVLFTCAGCHGEDLQGGGRPGLNITADPEQGIGSWTQAELIRFLREDVRPDGTVTGLQTPHASAIGDLPDGQLGSLWSYLQTVE